MSEPIDVAFAINLPPEKAIQYLESKGYAFSFRWEDLAAQAQAKAFTVAGAMKLDLLQTIRGSVEKALKEGKTLQQFKKELTPELQKLGWWGKETEVTNPETREVRKTRVDGFRLRTIYNTNLQSAYMAGRYQSQLEDDFRPYWQYVATMDRRTRPAHAVLNETVLRKEDPFWNENYPPNGWGCRCRVRGLSQSKVDKLGLKIAKGENLRPIADKAFQGNPAKDRFDFDQMKNKTFSAVNNQPSFEKFGLLPAKDIPEEQRRESPPKTPSLKEISLNEMQKLAEEIFGLSNNEQTIISTKDLDQVIFDRNNVKHLFIKGDGRERYLNYIIPTLQNPNEIWLTQYEWNNGKTTYKELRKVYIGFYKEEPRGKDFAVVLLKGRDGSVFWNSFERKKGIDYLRKGYELL